MHILHKGEPHRVLKNQIVVTGTHSHTKNKLELQGIFSGKYENIVLPPHETLETVDIIRKAGQLIAKSKNKGQIMDLVSYETFDAEVQEELLEQLQEGDQVTFLEFQGKVIVLEKR